MFVLVWTLWTAFWTIFSLSEQGEGQSRHQCTEHALERIWKLEVTSFRWANTQIRYIKLSLVCPRFPSPQVKTMWLPEEKSAKGTGLERLQCSWLLGSRTIYGLAGHYHTIRNGFTCWANTQMRPYAVDVPECFAWAHRSYKTRGWVGAELRVCSGMYLRFSSVEIFRRALDVKKGTYS